MQRDFGQLYEDAVKLASAAGVPPPMASSGADAAVPVPADVVNRAQRLLLSTGGYDVEATARDAQQLQVKVRAPYGVESGALRPALPPQL